MLPVIRAGVLAAATLLCLSAVCPACSASEPRETPAPDSLAISVPNLHALELPGLAELDQLDVGNTEVRLASYLNRVWQNGNDFLIGNVADSGDNSVSLPSTWQGSGLSSWVIFRMPVNAVAPTRFAVRWYEHLGEPEDMAAFHALHADFDKGRWVYDGLAYDETTSLFGLPAAGVLSPAGHTYIALLCYEHMNAAILAISAWSDVDHEAPVIDDGTALHVGPGQTYADIDSAYAAAVDSATIIVHPLAGNAPYQQPHLQVHKPGISFVADNSALAAGERVRLQGGSFNYTGAGSTPRAVFQFNPGADKGRVQGFEIFDAHNDSFNGAAVRINQANDVSVVDCEVHGCDMGIMSNGDAASGTGARQLIISCLIHENGNLSDPGYNHNLYLGGHSVTMRHCEVYGALTGHNVKSRAHTNRLEYCYIHDSANREIDFVDSPDTELEKSDSLLLGCVIVKAANMNGNRHVIHFGQDGGFDHIGRLHIANCTIVSPYLSPFFQITALSARLYCINTLFWGTENPAGGQTLFAVANGAIEGDQFGEYCWLSSGIDVPEFWYLEICNNVQGTPTEHPPFADPATHDFHLTAGHAGITDEGRSLLLKSQFIPVYSYFGSLPYLLDEYRPVACGSVRPLAGELDIGAYEYVP
jgi:hypothetical protein